MVIATQNPVESHGTYRLPEAQLDRFMIRGAIGYPAAAAELAVLKAQLHQAAHPVSALRPVLTAAQLASLVAAAAAVHVGDDLLGYIAAIVDATRKDTRIRLGVSPRGALALMRAAQALALLDGHEFVEPANIKALLVPVLAHRIILNADFERGEQGERSAERVLSEVAARVPPPVR